MNLHEDINELRETFVPTAINIFRKLNEKFGYHKAVEITFQRLNMAGYVDREKAMITVVAFIADRAMEE